ncbi:hypothetical protein [Sporolactobacillus sp. KGMB 08714]|uniref:hypothetical protein n=1 Tax=Sporolactobacillus sp. KGMB 08714 TaxID=3064704 RepID=UPI002FBD3E93
MEKLEDAITEAIPLHVYFFEDGENHWILALNEQQACDYYEKEYNPDFAEEMDGYDVHQVTEEELDSTKIDDEGEMISLRELVGRLTDRSIPQVIASSIY